MSRRTRWCDCKPGDFDEDRTHSVRYDQAHYDGEPGGPPAWTDGGTAELACTHNDAVDLAAAVAARFDCRMRQLGGNGHWAGSDISEGYGDTAEVFIWRGPAEEDYDAARAADPFLAALAALDARA